jgi:hypothetical protein
MKLCHLQENGWNWRSSRWRDKQNSKSQISHVLADLWNLDLKWWWWVMSVFGHCLGGWWVMSVFGALSGVVMGHECIWGTVWGVSGRSRDKGKDTEGWRGCKYAAQIHMKTVQWNPENTIWKWGRRQRGNGNIMEVRKLFSLHCTHVWNYHNETHLYY